MIITAILNFPPLPRFEDLRARLLSFESQLLRTKPEDSSSTTALVTTQSPTANFTHSTSSGRGQSRGNGRNGRRGNSRGRGRAPWHSTLDYSGYGSGRGYYWPQQTGGRGLLGAHPSQASQWCSTCSTSQHSQSHCPHRYHGPESLTAPFIGMHVAQYPPPPDFTWFPDTGATHHMTSSAPPDSVPFTGNTSVLLGNEASLPIAKIGNILVSLGSRNLSLNNVFHVPSLNKNLLSVARFTKDNFVSFTFTPSSYVLREHSQLATLDLYQLSSPPDSVHAPLQGSTDQLSPLCLAPALAVLDIVPTPVPHDTAPVVPEPAAAPLPQHLQPVPHAPLLPSHPMTTRLHDGIR
ncbi:hypothetical protein LWI29_005658 [Acer saccharum]|uniref:Retrovirus-related Pol polyprotein from transposon TNT 1-94-like beta-barrel domain-containing protein n=1 Tax=Acer saccharum TaxID=4024 RepID=A0AA39VXW9_ACESA|nr:hypothetical protein LWI29_005658 [Acer saccharum]